MLEERQPHRVLIVSDADKIADYITELLPPREFSPILRAGLSLIHISNTVPD